MFEWCKQHWLFVSILVAIVVFWIMGLTTYVTYIVFTGEHSVGSGTAAAYATFFALPPLLGTGFKKWLDRQEQKDKLKYELEKERLESKDNDNDTSSSV